MTPSRSKPGVAFWATVVVVVLVAYPLSFGPACWLAPHSETVHRCIHVLHYPILWMTLKTHREIAPGVFEEGWLDPCVQWYATCGRNDDRFPALGQEGEPIWWGN